MHKNTPIPFGKLHKAGEDYLEAILRLEKSKGVVRSVDIARKLNISKPSVSNAISVLGQAGHLTVDEDHFIHLTEEGRRNAERVYERHRFLKDFLMTIGVDEETAEDDACRMEHDISAVSFEALKKMWGQVKPRDARSESEE